jgi:hypothetical protein
MRYLYRASRDLPHLGLAPGDVLVWEPGGEYPYLRYHAVSPDPGAVLAAEQAGDLVPLNDPHRPAVVLRLIPGAAGSRRVVGALDPPGAA